MPGQSLRDILASAKATADAGQRAVFTLGRGLTVRVQLLEDRPLHYRITGERDSVQPGHMEMDILRREFGGEQDGEGMEWVGFTCRKWIDVQHSQPAEVKA